MRLHLQCHRKPPLDVDGHCQDESSRAAQAHFDGIPRVSMVWLAIDWQWLGMWNV